MGSPPRGASCSSAAAASPLTAAEISSGMVGSTEIPKSPPKWPLRPGVLAYVKGDTKQNICAARNGGGGGTATSTMNQSVGSNGTDTAAAVVTDSPLNKSTVSYMSTAAGNRQQRPSHGSIRSGGGINNETMTAPGDRVLRKALKTIVLSEDVAIQVEDDDDDDDEEDERGAEQQQQQGQTQQEEGDETNVDELINFTNSNFINRILKRLRWKRSRGGGGIAGGFDNRRRSPMTTAGPKKAKKSRRRLLLLRKMPLNGLFGSWKSTNSHTELFDSTRHRPSGIKYPSSGNWLFLLFILYTHITGRTSHG